MADFSLGSVLNVAREARIPVQDYANIVRWHEVLMNLPGLAQGHVHAAAGESCVIHMLASMLDTHAAANIGASRRAQSSAVAGIAIRS